MLQAVKDEKHREAIAAESGPQARLRDIAAFSARKQDGLLTVIRHSRKDRRIFLT